MKNLTRLFKANKINFLLLFLGINLVQAYFTVLGNDEAYYWDCGNNFDLGYFSHPPLTMWMANLGYQIFPNELGVRLLNILMGFITQLLFLKLINPKHIKSYFLIIFSSLIINVGTFYVSPDTPLLFFLTLFIFFMKKYQEKDSVIIALFIGVCCALVGLSKYSGVVFIAAAFFANLSFFKRPSFYLAIVAGTLVFLPHALWLYNNDFLPVKFHLYERSPEGWLYYYPLHYVLGLLLILGPLTGFHMIYAFFKASYLNSFEKMLKFIGIGVMLFFLYTSFKTRVESNWLAIMVLPAVYFSYQFYFSKKKKKKYVTYLFVANLVVVMLFRVALMLPSLLESFNIKSEFNEPKWVYELEDRANGKPIVFINSYQNTSKYNFYSKHKGAYCLSLINHTGSSYLQDYKKEKKLQNKEVLVVTQYLPNTQSFKVANREISYSIVKEFSSYNRVRVSLKNFPNKMKRNSKQEIAVEVHNPTNETIYLKTNTELLISNFIEHHEFVPSRNILNALNDVDSIKPHERITFNVFYNSPDSVGEFRVRSGLSNGGFFNNRNSFVYFLDVVD